MTPRQTFTFLEWHHTDLLMANHWALRSGWMRYLGDIATAEHCLDLMTAIIDRLEISYARWQLRGWK